MQLVQTAVLRGLGALEAIKKAGIFRAGFLIWRPHGDSFYPPARQTLRIGANRKVGGLPRPQPRSNNAQNSADVGADGRSTRVQRVCRVWKFADFDKSENFPES